MKNSSEGEVLDQQDATSAHTPGTTRIKDGSRVVGEIYPPEAGTAKNYWYRNLLTGAEGKGRTFDEARDLLEEDLKAYRSGHGRALTMRVAASVGATRSKPGRKRGKTEECPHCGRAVASLGKHIWEVHQLGLSTASTTAPGKSPSKTVPGKKQSSRTPTGAPPRRKARPERGVAVEQRNPASQGAKAHRTTPSKVQRVSVSAPNEPPNAAPIQHSALPPATQAGNRRLVHCPDCGDFINPTKLKEHRIRMHGEQPARLSSTTASLAHKRRRP